ncbi:hypothetical protein [Methylosinus sp. Ce-a6]|uniref:hypothetical protein n=1 Tax=Methylosinus sp. Ce-a6 TaxID=2172005 RepID=UPI001358C7A0|nr:hypothetical protein [Methylosinus sp. Ce-a6]
MAERFREDRESGLAFPEAWDPSDTARLIVSLIWGIAVEVHSDASAPDVHRMISHFLATWPDP